MNELYGQSYKALPEHTHFRLSEPQAQAVRASGRAKRPELNSHQAVRATELNGHGPLPTSTPRGGRAYAPCACVAQRTRCVRSAKDVAGEVSLPCFARCYAIGGVVGFGFGARFARAFCAFAYASGLRFLKYVSVSVTCFAFSVQVEPFAFAGRGYVRRRYARTTLPEIPSVAARSSGRVNFVTLAISVFPFRSCCSLDLQLQSSSVAYERQAIRVTLDLWVGERTFVRIVTTPPSAPPRLPTRNFHANAWARSALAARVSTKMADLRMKEATA